MASLTLVSQLARTCLNKLEWSLVYLVASLNSQWLLGPSSQARLDDYSHMWSDGADLRDEMEEFVFETSQSDWRYFNRDQMG